jgi:RNA polymerase sigma factor (TIGR02999 family)
MRCAAGRIFGLQLNATFPVQAAENTRKRSKKSELAQIECDEAPLELFLADIRRCPTVGAFLAGTGLSHYPRGTMTEVTQILTKIEHGDPHAADELLPLVYAELRRLALQKLTHETPGQTLDPTGLVHEAYLRLVPCDQIPAGQGQHWDGRGHFFAAAAEAMRRILVENARRKSRLKHGGALQRVDVADIPAQDPADQVLALDDALTRLAAEDAQAAQVVNLHHFGGLSHDLVAEALGVTIYQARQKWSYARAWLRDALRD